MQGQLGDGTTTSSSMPVGVAGITDAVEVRTGDTASCARRANGTIMCWGDNTRAALGDATLTSSPVPVQVVGITGATALRLGRQFGCALADGKLHCWGWNGFGTFGNLAPVYVPTAPGVTVMF